MHGWGYVEDMLRIRKKEFQSQSLQLVFEFFVSQIRSNAVQSINFGFLSVKLTFNLYMQSKRNKNKRK